MRAVFGFLVMVLVMAGVLQLARMQSRALAPAGSAQPAAASAAQTQPQAVGAQVQGLLEQGAARASEAQP